MLKNYAYHRIKLRLLGKNECKNTRIGDCLADNNSVMTERDYSEALKVKFDMEIQSYSFGLNLTL